jgi:gluconate 2-dehydrogenase gamma chain
MRRYPRRAFIQQLAFFGGGVVLLGGCSRNQPGASAPSPVAATPHLVLNERQYATLSAACERILPHDEDAGALDAGVPGFIDRQLTTKEMQTLKPVMLTGLNLLERRGRGLSGKSFADASPAQQDELLRDLRDSQKGSGEARFYELLVVMTLEGFLGDPSYGGNKDGVGWKLVGFNVSGPTHSHHHHPGR